MKFRLYFVLAIIISLVLGMVIGFYGRDKLKSSADTSQQFCKLNGTVTDSGGQPADNVYILATATDGSGKSGSDTTDASGRYEIDSLQATSYNVVAIKGPFNTQGSVTFTMPGEIQTLNLQLGNLGHTNIIGTVTNRDTGDRIAGVNVVVSGEYDLTTTTDSEGNYNASHPWIVVPSNPDGYIHLTLSFIKEGFEQSVISISVLPGSETTLDRSLIPKSPMKAVIDGSVKDTKNNPIANAQIVAFNSLTGISLNITKTDQNGKYVLDVPLRGNALVYTIYLNASAPGFKPDYVRNIKVAKGDKKTINFTLNKKK